MNVVPGMREAEGMREADWCLVGLLAGVGVLTRTMVGELCDKTNRVEGMSRTLVAFRFVSCC